MIKRYWPGMLALLLSVIFMVVGYWRFPELPFSVPVTLRTGESALVSGSLPSNAWLGDETDLKLTFRFTSPISAGKAQIRAEIVMPNAEVTPNGPLTLIMDPSESIGLAWKIRPTRVGDLEGTLWVNSAVEGSELQAVLAKPFHLHSMTVLGISAAWIRRAGWVFFTLAVFYLAAFAGRQSRSRGRSREINP